MNTRFHNSHPRRLAAESLGIALMRSGSYVLRELDKKEYDALVGIDFSRIKFSPELSVVVVNDQSASRRGKLARFAYLSLDGLCAKYPHAPDVPSYISLQLIKARSYSRRDFPELIKDNPLLHVRRLHDSKDFFGILFGNYLHMYSTLVVDATALGR